MAQFSIAQISAILGTTAALIYTVPAGTEVNAVVSATNYTTSTALLTLWVVESGGTRGNQHYRLVDYVINPKEPRRVIDHEALAPGTMIYAAASVATAIALQVTGTTRSTA